MIMPVARTSFSEAQVLGSNIRRFRLAMGLSQTELATMAGVRVQAISLLETGKQLPVWDTACRIADALQVSLNQLRDPNGLLVDRQTK
jgi:transcriptional regulator with XRE-family HTH domain